MTRSEFNYVLWIYLKFKELSFVSEFIWNFQWKKNFFFPTRTNVSKSRCNFIYSKWTRQLPNQQKVSKEKNFNRVSRKELLKTLKNLKNREDKIRENVHFGSEPSLQPRWYSPNRQGSVPAMSNPWLRASGNWKKKRRKIQMFDHFRSAVNRWEKVSDVDEENLTIRLIA